MDSTAHRAHFAHANMCSRVAGGPEQAPARFVLWPLSKTIIHHSRVSCLLRSNCGLTSRFFFFRNTFPLYCVPRTALNKHTIHGQTDSLVGWLCKVPSLQLLQKHWDLQEDRTPMMRHGSVIRLRMYLTPRRPSMRQDQSTSRNVWKIMTSTDGFLLPYCVKWLVWKDRPSSRAWKVPSLLPNAFAKGASKPPSPAVAENCHADPG